MDAGELKLWELELAAWRRRLIERAAGRPSSRLAEAVDAIARRLEAMQRRPPRGKVRARRELAERFARLRTLEELERAQAAPQL